MDPFRHLDELPASGSPQRVQGNGSPMRVHSVLPEIDPLPRSQEHAAISKRDA